MHYDKSVTLQDLALNLTEDERLAADLLLAREYTPKKERPTYDQIAEQLGISVRQLYTVRNKPAFITYFRALTETKLATYHAKADSMLIQLIDGGNNGIGSIKALELYYKLTGRLNSDTTVTFADERSATKRMTDQDVNEEIAKLSASLKRLQ
ncbi:hypothetical protein BACCIP111899_01596 [Bacillus rhizoplanae]|uniref:Homeodomain phBC6A51-type domain-containing protein n=1 Tax=Bacillus rhizoplanae TaxID=2880966 RepID=A0ABM8Y9I7_9BACI|nr:phBC6A51 family helix-turn-helix protein [Bacillus rhizoplanae]CAG9612420.1 hypothetical protein BACCIP111899_01596 [Bacillus rhizoplanae]